MSILVTPMRCLKTVLLCTTAVITIYSVLQVYLYEGYAARNILSPIVAYIKAPPRITPKMTTIPHQLHFLADSELVLTGYRQTMVSCAGVNSDWTVFLWTRADVESLLLGRQLDLLHFYQSLGSESERIEFAKFMVLYHIGDVVLESDVECLKSLSGPAKAVFGTAFVAEERLENVLVYDNRLFRLSSAVLGSIPGHGFLAFIVDVMQGKAQIDNLRLDKDFLSDCYRHWLTLDSNSSSLTVLPSEVFSPDLQDPDTMRLLCAYHREANLSRVYRLRDRGCAMLSNATNAVSLSRPTLMLNRASDSSLGAHRHLHPARLANLQTLLARGESGAAVSNDTIGGRFNATKLLKARRFANRQSKLPDE